MTGKRRDPVWLFACSAIVLGAMISAKVAHAGNDGVIFSGAGTDSGTATGSVSFAISNSIGLAPAIAAGQGAMVLGVAANADASTSNAIVMGVGASTNVTGSLTTFITGPNFGQIAIGANSRAFASGGTAVGGVTTGNTNNISGAEAEGVNSTAIGASALAGGVDQFGVGVGNPLPFQNAGTTAIGSFSQAGATAAGQTNATAVGFTAQANGANASALGTNAKANNANASAFGNGATASGVSSLALGDSALASATGAVAVGLNSKATGANAIAIGNGATATGSIAVGNGASAGNGGAAFGDGSSATFANSAAIGPGAVATRANQVMVGTASNTYTLSGINSAASLAAQTGPTKFVTADANGNLATASLSVPDITGLQNNVALLQGSVGVLQNQMKQSFEGTAIAVAMGGSALPSDKRFAISSNWGTFRGQNAGSFLAQARVNDYVVLNGGVGFGFAQGGVAGRAGVTFAW
jgi:hypothetical protein